MENFTTKTRTTFGKFIKTSFLSAALMLLAFGTASAQCPLGCNNSVQISLNTTCMVEVTPDMVLEGQGGSTCDYTVQVLGSNNQPIPNSPFVGADYIGQTLTVKISLGANSCWGSISIEDKLPPVIDCPADMTISCYESSNFANPVATDNCDGTIAVDIVSDETVDLDCTNTFSAVRTIIYQATDASGNESAFCTKNIYFTRIGLVDIVFPDSKDDVEDPALECDNLPFWDANGDGYPQPSETGTPTTTDGYNIFPNNSYCELNATFADQVLPICESSFKVLRTWTVLDWCTADIKEEFQIIKVVDNEVPIVSCFQDQTYVATADPYNCLGTWDAIAPTVIYDCSSTTYTVDYLVADPLTGGAPVNGIYIDDNVVTNGDGTYTLIDLPLDSTWVRYTIADACGNVSFCYTEILIVDDVPPVPVCDEFTVATLTNNGFAHIFAESFDDGSHDNCSDVTFDVRRMTPGCGTSTSVWTEYAEFCCADVGNEVMVSLRVTDASGNSNTCMVTVTVQDKIAPLITCPANITVGCGADIDAVDASGNYITGHATGTDNCAEPVITTNTTGSISDCGEGVFLRRFTATDAGGLDAVCTQRITVEDESPFSGGSIGWPSNKTLNGCADVDTDPSNTGEPTYPDDMCSQVADTYEDQQFTFVDGVCLKILRTWTVIDWCTFDQNNPNDGGIYQYTQVIKVSNSVKPTFNTCTDITVEAFGQDCNGYAEIIVGATDDCTPESELEYEYSLDIDNDGSINAVGSSNDASRTLDVGTHKITYTVEDQCGNQTECMFLINVVDKKKPTPYCLSEITTVIMPSAGQIDIWASDFDLGSSDNCPGAVQISFSSNVNNTQMFFDCDQLGMNQVEIWVTDASGNQDFCTTTINIQDNGGCLGAKISGSVANTDNELINEVKVTKTNMTNYSSEFYMTPFGGKYNFVNPEIETSFEIKAEKNTDHANGVSTLDLVLIQRHILGLQELDSPYKVIAGDINGNEKLTSSDLLELRKLILGINTEYSSNQSWRFVDANQTFNDITDPFPFNEKVMVLNYNNENVSGKNFVGVKIGDVNNSAAVNNVTGDNASTTRSNNTLSLNVDNVSYTAGDLVSIPVTADNFTDMVGFQFTMEAAGMEFVEVKAGALNIANDNVATFNKEEAMTISWNTSTEVSTEEGEVLFTVVMRANTNNELSDAIDITSTITTAEAYTSSLEIDGVEINVRGEYTNVDVQFELFQNTPNPFDGFTTIPFNLPETGNVTLNVFDITGKVIFNTRGEYTKGMNEITLDNTNMNAKGIMYYQLEFNGTVATKKMISL